MAILLNTIVSFNGGNGSLLEASLIADVNGNLFGTTVGGGANNDGIVFKIVKTASGYASTPTTLVSFNGSNGSSPNASLIADCHGNLFGTTANGGANGFGTVFEIVRTASGYADTPTTLVSFNGSDGYAPFSGLIADANGDLFGTTQLGGTNNHGTVFEVVKAALAYDSSPTTLVSFNGGNGHVPLASLIADANGDLFGTTLGGGANSDGTVFEIVKTASGYASTPTTLVSFNGSNGSSPNASLIADSYGNLFGTTANGGANGFGTVFEIVKTASGYASTPTTLVSFNGSNGSVPSASLIADANGDLFGTTQVGGTSNKGTVFEVVKTDSGYDSSPTTLVSFNGGNGYAPTASLIADANGDLFGTTLFGGTDNQGTVFEITGSGFVPFVKLGISGAIANQHASFLGLMHPFGSVMITDLASQTETVTITSSSTISFLGGVLFDSNARTDGSHYANGVYTVTGSAAAVTADIEGLQFLAGIGTTKFNISVTDTTGHTVTDHAVSVVGLSFGLHF